MQLCRIMPGGVNKSISVNVLIQSQLRTEGWNKAYKALELTDLKSAFGFQLTNSACITIVETTVGLYEFKVILYT